MEVEIRQGVCNNSPAEWTSPENGWRLSVWPILFHCCYTMQQWVGGHGGFSMKLLAWAWVKQLLVQILVVVANIQMRALKTEVEKGFMWTAVGHGLVDPRRQGCSAHAGFASYFEREWGSYSPTKTWITNGNVKEFVNASGSFGKRCLFFLTTFFPEIRLPGDRVNRLVLHLVIRGVRCASNCHWKAERQIYLHSWSYP